MHALDILPQWSSTGGRKRSRFAIVTIRDDSSVPVAGATVTGEWNGCKRGTGSGVTDCTGRAIVDGGNVSCANECIDVFTVTDVTHDVVLLIGS